MLKRKQPIVWGIAIAAKCVGASVAAISLDVYVNIKLTYGHMDDLLNLQIWWPCFMAGQPTHPTYSNPPPEIRPYDQGVLTIGFP